MPKDPESSIIYKQNLENKQLSIRILGAWILQRAGLVHTGRTTSGWRFQANAVKELSHASMCQRQVKRKGVPRDALFQSSVNSSLEVDPDAHLHGSWSCALDRDLPERIRGAAQPQIWI